MFWDWILLGVVFFLEFIHHGDYTVETLGHICPQPVLKEPNAQSAVRSFALIKSVSYSHCLPLRLWGRAKGFYFIFFAQSKLRKAKRSKGNIWKDILRLLLKRFHRFKLSLSSPELLQVTDVLTLFLCGCVCWRGVGEYIFWIFSS